MSTKTLMTMQLSSAQVREILAHGALEKTTYTVDETAVYVGYNGPPIEIRVNAKRASPKPRSSANATQ